MSKRVPLEWSDPARLRLKTPGEIVAVYDGGTKLAAEQWYTDPASGETMLFVEPAGEITAELKQEAPARVVKADS